MSAPSSPPSNGTAPAASPPTAPAPTPPPVVPAPPPKAPPPVSPPPVSPAPPPKAPPPTSPSPPTANPPPVTPASPPSTPDTPVAPPTPLTPDTPPSAPSPPSPSNPTPSNPTPSNPSPSKPNSPPSPPSTPSSSPSPSNSLSTPIVVGIAAGGIVVLLIASLICVLCMKKKKRRREDNIPMQYSGPPPPPGMYKEDPYVRPYQQWQQPPDHVVKPSMDPGPPPPYGSRPPQGPPTPPPPPPGQINSGGSGSNYSGGDHHPPPSPGMVFGMSKSTFTYEELVIATDGFSDANLLGQGGFGYVHKGVLPNGKEVAVKQLKIGSGQGEREFQAEVDIISRVHHKHLVSLVGYCMSGNQRLLVYEFVPNNTLEFHLHGKGRPTMEWPTRLRIALGSAKGLAYLHEDCHPKIIHRDIKASNILLDYKFEAKVADFGLAKFTEENNTHVSTRVMGTFGYLAPEYASSGKLTEKSDVFSFGVMVLELITGRRPVDTTQTYMDDSLVDWARPLMQRGIEDGNYEQLVDPKLQKNYRENEMARMIAVAAACVRHSAKRRPRMSMVVRALEGDTSLEDLQDGMLPGHSRYVGGSYTSSEYESSTYNEDMKKFRKMAMQSGDYQSSQYSAPTSEYGLNPSGSSSEGQNTREMDLGKMKKKDSY